ncbi:DUF3817 domain-containing protein [Paenibacillus sp. PK4536]|uniref:Putative membrane protein YdzA n=1 Tax=Paenibacillus nuruki TaxID=1886670 RepID=A0A1E3KZ60_9BACL|nr:MULTISPECIES: DUF3817 domain-containing protein [Paenibacillus]ODP26832.1 putative membrane protein YdzA [Paenibacillus nuruki]TKJ90631.1 DUF3817 domain-containing protein [Paenibacillus sp. CFBP13512]WIM39223.1 DUF3817 domain-containing protein [Paenibacillus sp. PK4536]CAJ1314082.1 DUF3817 domain-containing protein [Paenibacillus nuruki]
MIKNALSMLRVIGNVEAVSYLALVLIAMPLKYFANMPLAVTYVGMIHGVLFVAYVAAIGLTLILRKISFKQAILGLVASILPFGPFVFDRYLHRQHQRDAVEQTQIS